MLPRVLLWLAIVALGSGVCEALQKPLASVNIKNDKPLLVAVMGQTGSGKSSFLNNVVGRDRFKVGDEMHGQTSEVDDELIEIDGRRIRLVDTPGFDDTNLTDTEVLEMIVTWMGVQYKQKTKFAGILYLRDITEFRMKGSGIANLRMFKALCGTTGLENVVIVTTKWNIMNGQLKTAEHREEQLLSEYLRPMMHSGAEYARDNGTTKSSREIVRKVIRKNRAFYLDLQPEIVDEGKRLNEIEAGKVLQEQLLKLEKKHQEKIEALNEELQNAHSHEMREALKEERRKAAEALEKAKASQDRLDEEYSKKFEEQEKLFLAMMEKLHKDYEEKIQKASEQDKEQLRKQQEELEKALKKAKDGDSSFMWSIVSQAALTAGVNFVLPLLLAQIAPKIGLGGAGMGGAMPAPQAAPQQPMFEAPPIINLNYVNDPMSAQGGALPKWESFPSWGNVPAQNNIEHWLMNGLGYIAEPLIELIVD